jgi:hypothetical protein
MLFPSECELFFGAGIEEDVRMSNLDFNKVLPKITDKPFRVMKYWDLVPSVAKQQDWDLLRSDSWQSQDLTQNLPLEFYNIILYHYPGFVGHWTLFCVNDDKRKLYFFDPYGKDVDTQWPNLKGYSKFEKSYTILSNIIDKYKDRGYTYSSNPYNIQGELIENCITKKCQLIAENQCGEIICYRILYKDLTDLEFYELCVSDKPTKIFKTISLIEKVF